MPLMIARSKMAATYCFRREDGRVVERQFPFGKCPKEIVDEDGMKARHIFTPANIQWAEGFMPEATASARNERRRMDNIRAGERGRADWKAQQSGTRTVRALTMAQLQTNHLCLHGL